MSDLRHLTHAADELGRSQSAITRSISDLEKFLDVRLFERTATGMAKTREGGVLFARVRAAVDHMAAVGGELVRKSPADCDFRRTARHLLDLDIGNSYIFAFLAVCDHRDIQEAARSLNIASSTVRKLVVELERQLGLPLFQRAPRGIVYPTEFAQNIATGMKRALWEIRAGMDELKSLDGCVEGSVRIGVMSTGRSFIVPHAINQLHKVHLRVLVHIYWASYDDLQVALSCGDIDFIVGTLRHEEVGSVDNSATNLVQDRIEVVARAEHPLCNAKDVPLEELLNLDWILPPPNSALRAWFRSLLAVRGLSEPRPFIQTASLAILRGVLLDSDCVALATRLQCWHDLIEYHHLSVLPVRALRRARVEEPFYLHLTRRTGAVLSPAGEALWGAVAKIASEVEARFAASPSV